MGKIVLLDFVDGDFDNGFTVKLRIETEGDRIWIGDAKGRLAGCQNILSNYKDWQSRYLARVAAMRSGVRITGSVVPDASPQAIQAAGHKLKESLNNWLSSPSMFSIEREILHKLTDKSEEIRFIFQTEVPQLQQLPWYSWDIFRQPNYIKSEAGLYLPVGQLTTAVKKERVKVLAVFGKQEGIGNATKIKTEKDWELLQKYLSVKSNAELIRLDDKPDDKLTLEKLCGQIEAHCPQIFFFAGHSSSEDDGKYGSFVLNDQESITIDNLESDLIEAVEQGLQLAIFNSCKGLAIARQLANIRIPNIIVMREPIPDEVAHKFLQRFLEAFAQGKPLHLAVRKAREKINRLENKYPGATWLPVIFQNPAEPPLTWGRLGGVEILEESAGNQNSVTWLPTSTLNEQNYPITPITNNNSSLPTTQRVEPIDDLTKLQLSTAIEKNLPIHYVNCSKGHLNHSTNKFCTDCGESLLVAEQSALTGIANQDSMINFGQEEKSSEITIRGRYKIIKPLAKGGFGTTFLAKDIDFPSNRLCVVKQLTLKSKSEYVLWLFQKEAEVLSKLGQHPQIPQLFAFFEHNEEFYLVQEFIDGKDLTEELIPGEQKSETYVILLLRDVLRILEFVHEQGVIHRDIKPSNLIRRKQDGKLVLIDFGAVKKIGNITTEGNTQPLSAIIGTPGYFAPEQVAEFPQLSSDIYSLGIVCIKALTGIFPAQLRKNIETGEIDWRSQANVSPQFARILDKMTRYDYRDRYQSVNEVLQDLNRSIGTGISHDTVPPMSLSKIHYCENRKISATHLNTLESKRKIKLILVAAFLIGSLVVIFVPRVLKRENSTPTPKQHTSLATDNKWM